MLVQIYEIQTPHEAEKCITLGVDHIGSVLNSNDSWRQPQLKETIRLSQGTPTKNSLIPLFLDTYTLYRVLDYYGPHYIHLCDNLTDQKGAQIYLEPFIQMQEALKEKFPEIGIIRSLPVPLKGHKDEFPTLNIARVLEHLSDIFLTDTWVEDEPVKGFIGLTGLEAEWKIAEKLVSQSDIPVILAGGLSHRNVYDVLMSTRAAGADSCTLTNMVDHEGKALRFKKDFQKVEKFLKEVRRAGEDLNP